jgi:phage baseplate assembly protein W
VSTNRSYEIAISLPFSISQYGRVSDTKTQEKIWADRVHTVIGTALTERIMLPTFGSGIPNSMFDTTDSATKSIKDAVRMAFNSWLELLTLVDTAVTIADDNATVSVAISYMLPNQELITTNVAVSHLNGNTPNTQENI